MALLVVVVIVVLERFESIHHPTVFVIVGVVGVSGWGVVGDGFLPTKLVFFHGGFGFIKRETVWMKVFLISKI